MWQNLEKSIPQNKICFKGRVDSPALKMGFIVISILARRTNELSQDVIPHEVQIVVARGAAKSSSVEARRQGATNKPPRGQNGGRPHVTQPSPGPTRENLSTAVRQARRPPRFWRALVVVWAEKALVTQVRVGSSTLGSAVRWNPSFGTSRKVIDPPLSRA